MLQSSIFLKSGFRTLSFPSSNFQLSSLIRQRTLREGSKLLISKAHIEWSLQMRDLRMTDRRCRLQGILPKMRLQRTRKVPLDLPRLWTTNRTPMTNPHHPQKKHHGNLRGPCRKSVEVILDIKWGWRTPNSSNQAVRIRSLR